MDNIILPHTLNLTYNYTETIYLSPIERLIIAAIIFITLYFLAKGIKEAVKNDEEN